MDGVLRIEKTRKLPMKTAPLLRSALRPLECEKWQSIGTIASDR
jgi:hypothetical protein